MKKFLKVLALALAAMIVFCTCEKEEQRPGLEISAQTIGVTNSTISVNIVCYGICEKETMTLYVLYRKANAGADVAFTKEYITEQSYVADSIVSFSQTVILKRLEEDTEYEYYVEARYMDEVFQKSEIVTTRTMPALTVEIKDLSGVDFSAGGYIACFFDSADESPAMKLSYSSDQKKWIVESYDYSRIIRLGGDEKFHAICTGSPFGELFHGWTEGHDVVLDAWPGAVGKSFVMYQLGNASYDLGAEKLSITLNQWTYLTKFRFSVAIPEILKADDVEWSLDGSDLLAIGYIRLSDYTYSVNTQSPVTKAESDNGVFWFADTRANLKTNSDNRSYTEKLYLSSEHHYFSTIKEIKAYYDDKYCSTDLTISDFINGRTDPSNGDERQGSWVQLWEHGPKFATVNVGSRLADYTSATNYTSDKAGGLYAWDLVQDYRGKTMNETVYRQVAAPNDVVAASWHGKWRTPTAAQMEALPENTVIEWCDGSTKKFAPGCTLRGAKVSGKPGTVYQNLSVFFPTSSQDDLFTEYWLEDQYGSDANNHREFSFAADGKMNLSYAKIWTPMYIRPAYGI